MLTYLIQVTEEMMTLSVLLGVICAFMEFFCADRAKQIFRIGIAAGFVIAAVRAYITNTRRLVGGWRVGVYGYVAGLILFAAMIVLFIIFGIRFFQKKDETQESRGNAAQIVLSCVIALLVVSYLYGGMPNVYVYPFKFDTGGNGLLSTDFLFRLGGWLLGILGCFLAGLSSYHILTVLAKKGMPRLLTFTFFAMNGMYAVYNFARLMLVLTPRKIVDSIVLFKFAASSNNNAEWYSYAAFFVLIVLSIILWVKSATLKEPYATKAEHRKQRALWRNGKRYSIVMIPCFALAILCATLFVKLNTVVIREAPVEDPVIAKSANGEDEELWVPLEYVMDGHLHRFGYTTDEGTQVRFIVVLKQENTNNYGVGLDACEICGIAGYYENSDGQVVCKKCGVVMNTTTIGMKGGCNPIIIDYDINEAYITVPVSEMVNNAERFK